MKNTEVAGGEGGGPCWSSSAVLLILENNTEVYLPSSATESRLGYALRCIPIPNASRVSLAEPRLLGRNREGVAPRGYVYVWTSALLAPCRPREQYYSKSIIIKSNIEQA